MGSIIHVFNLSSQVVGEKLLSSTIKRVRKVAAERNVKVPKRMTFGGDCSGWMYISYTSNAVRDIIIEILERNGHPFMLDREYSFHEFQTKLKQLLLNRN